MSGMTISLPPNRLSDLRIIVFPADIGLDHHRPKFLELRIDGFITNLNSVVCLFLSQQWSLKIRNGT